MKFLMLFVYFGGVAMFVDMAIRCPDAGFRGMVSMYIVVMTILLWVLFPRNAKWTDL